MSAPLSRFKPLLLTILLLALLCGTWANTTLGQTLKIRADSALSNWSPAQLQAAQRGINYWNSIINSPANWIGQNERTVYFWLGPHPDTGSTTGSTGGWGTYNGTYSGFVRMGNGIPIAGDPWGPGISNSQIKQNEFQSIMIHELAHVLGYGMDNFTVNADKKTVTFDASLWGPWGNNLYTGTGEKVQAGKTYNIDPSTPFTFRGTNARAVWGDSWWDGTGRNVPVESGQNGAIRQGSTISHLAIPFGNMNAYYEDNTRPFFSEVELAVMQDLGHDITRSNYFGRSIYETHTTGTITNNTGFNGSGDYGIGLHVVAGGNTIIQNANLTASGWAGAGIRIETTGRTTSTPVWWNTVTINPGITVSATGQSGVGVLVTHGGGTVLINRGTIRATGSGGRGVWFNADTTAFHNSGVINAGTASDAIRISEGVNVPVINFMQGTTITGNIYSASTAYPRLTFGQAMDSSGKATEKSGGDRNSFTINVNGNIGTSGSQRYIVETWGGRTNFNGTVNANSGTVGKGTTSSQLVLLGDARFGGGLTVENLGMLNVGNGGTVGSITGNILNDGRVTFQRSNNLTYSDVISGSGTVNKEGTGTLTLTGDNTYTGDTNVNAGTLQVGTATNDWANVNNVTVNSAGRVNNYANIDTARVNGGNLVNYVSAWLDNLTLNSGIAHSFGTVSDAVVHNGVLANDGGWVYCLTLNGGSVGNYGRIFDATINGGGLESISGTIDRATVNDGYLSNSSGATEAEVHTLALNGGNVYNDATIYDARVNNGEFTNDSFGHVDSLTQTGGTFMNDGGTVGNLSVSNTAMVTNSGNITGVAFQSGGTMTNDGNINQGMLLNGQFTNTGTVQNTQVFGGTFDNNNLGSVDGKVTASGGIFNNNAGGTVANTEVHGSGEFYNRAGMVDGKLARARVDDAMVWGGGTFTNLGGEVGNVTTLRSGGSISPASSVMSLSAIVPASNENVINNIGGRLTGITTIAHGDRLSNSNLDLSVWGLEGKLPGEIDDLRMYGGTFNNGASVRDMTYWSGTYSNTYDGGFGTIDSLNLAGDARGVDNWGTVNNLAFASDGSGYMTISGFVTGGVFSFTGIDVMSSVNLANANVQMNLFGSINDWLGLSSWNSIFFSDTKEDDWGISGWESALFSFSWLDDGLFTDWLGYGKTWTSDNGTMVAFNDAGMTTSATPEPATLVILGLGLAGLGYARRRQMRRATAA